MARPASAIVLESDSASSPSPRSEEHTSELQSRLHLVCRLLLEKKTKFRADVHAIGVPLTAICNATYSDARQRQLFTNIISLGALSALLAIEPAEIERLFAAQYT